MAAAAPILSNAMSVETLRNDDYDNWCLCVRHYLIANDLWDIIETDPPELDGEDEVKAWKKKNSASLFAIHMFCGRDDIVKIRKIDSAKTAWDELARMHQPRSLLEFDTVNPAQLDSGVDEGIDTSVCQEVNPVDSSQPQRVNSEISVDESNPQRPKSRFTEQPLIIDEDEKVAETEEGNQKSHTGVTTEVIIPLSSEDDKNKPPAIELSRRRSLTRSMFSKPKSRTEPVGYLEFHDFIHAINKGYLEGVKAFIDRHPEAKTAKIIPDGSRALHVACLAGQLKIVKELVERLSENDVKIKDNFGCTALTVVARNASLISIAKCLINKNKELLQCTTNQGFLPVVSSSLRYHKNMTRYLHYVSQKEYSQSEYSYLDDKNGSTLLISCILGNILDVAWHVIHECPWFATTKDVTGVTSPIRALARVNSIFPSGSKLAFWKRPIYSCIHVSLPYYLGEFRVDIPHDENSDKKNIVRQVLGNFLRLGSTLLGISGMKKLYEMKLKHRLALGILRSMCKEISTLQLSDPNYVEVRDSVFRAVQYGSVEFVVEMVKANPSLLYIRDQSYNGIFQYAVQYRQEKIFSLLYGLDARKDSLISSVDSQNCTITHLAGLLAPSSRLARISGAPLQMQRELQWYKEVKSVVGSIHDLYMNKEKETPDEVFTKTHKKLVKDGEEWMKQTANSCTVVGALIITVMFTAAFTVPGGNDQGTGYPMFLHKKLFTVFIISDAVSLFFSSTSVLMFLAILTSRYAEEDFLKSLPTKLIIGLSALFVSIASMMIAFCAALILMLKGELHIVVPLASLACIPIGLFVHLQFPLLREIFMSTYGPSIFDRKMKRWLF